MSVTVEYYNPSWPLNFQKIKSRLEGYLRDVSVLAIEHVGSTSVPGLASKPIIDIDIIVTRSNVQPAINALVNNGKFIYFGELGIVDRHALKDLDQDPPRNTYICVDGSPQTRNHLGVRDTLRANSELRDEYGKVKLELAARRTNIVDYIDAKSAVIMKILHAAGLLTEQEMMEIQTTNRKGERYGKIETERLELREFVMADVDGFYELESREEVVRYQSFSPRTKEEARDEVVKILQGSMARPREHIELVVEYEERLVGRVGSKFFPASTPSKDNNSENVEREWAHADLWFSFLPEYQKRGLATEAVAVLMKLLKEKNGEGKLEFEIECDPRNTGSWKLAEKLGFEKISLTEKAYMCKGEFVGSMVYRKIEGDDEGTE